MARKTVVILFDCRMSSGEEARADRLIGLLPISRKDAIGNDFYGCTKDKDI
jgi:hypothetical protein